MDYWAETMQDDCYLIAADGWKAETYRDHREGQEGQGEGQGWACDLVPKPLIVARYFAKEQAAIDQLAAELESVTRQAGRTGGGAWRRGGRVLRTRQGEQGQRRRAAEGDQGRQGGEGRGRRAERMAEAER